MVMTITMRVGVSVVVVMRLIVRVRGVREGGARAPGNERRTHDDDEGAGEDAQPRIELLGPDVMGRVQGNQAEREYPECVRRRHRQAQSERMTSGAACADQVGAHDRLTVPWRERVQGAQSSCGQQGQRQNERAKLSSRDQRREGVDGAHRACRPYATVKRGRAGAEADQGVGRAYRV